MCRLLMLQNTAGVSPGFHLEAFKRLSKDSKEFQGHGWGCAWLDAENNWQHYHNINPLWDDATSFPDTTLFLAHARSAFRDEGIVVENNMPFSDGENVFVFNGELQGVRIKAEGRIGAEKIFNTVKRFYKSDYAEATVRAVSVINKRTRYVRALNFFLANKRGVQICSQFGEDPDYFQLQETLQGSTRVVCSQRYDFGNNHWLAIANNQVFTINHNLD
jgi:predicted glutamine amidotransferase